MTSIQSEYTSNTTIADIARRLRAAGRILITTHVKPDGDAIGSTLSLARALERMGKQVELWYLPPVSSAFDTVITPTAYHTVTDGHRPSNTVDMALICDTGARNQLPTFAPWIEQHHDIACIIDHHIQGDADLSAWRLVEPGAAAACELSIRIIQELGVSIDRTIAEPLYLGLATDTGWFRFSNMRASTLRLAADLIDAGVDHSALFRLIEQTDRAGRLRLMSAALNSLEMINHNRAAIMMLSQQDYERCEATPDETHGFSDLPLSVESIEVVALAAQTSGDTVKLSLRSKPGPHAVDVNALARHFGGGGHARASGAKVSMPLADVRSKLIAVMSNI